MKKSETFNLHIYPQYIKPELGMKLNGKKVSEVIVKNSVVIVDGVEYNPSKRVIVTVPLQHATRVDL